MSISLYIPRMSSTFNEERVRAVFDRLMIGSVTRVDFASINAGEHLSPSDRFQKAFVHLSLLYDTEAANHLRSSLKTTQDSVRLCPDLFNQQVYWIVLLNKNPVAETKLNIHQVVENHRILEQVVFDQANLIHSLEARLEQLVMNTPYEVENRRIAEQDKLIISLEVRMAQLVRYMNFPEEVESELLEYDDMPPLISMEDLDEEEVCA